MTTFLLPKSPAVPASKVLVTVGYGANVSALGTNLAHRAGLTGHPHLAGYQALDARLVKLDGSSSFNAPKFSLPDGTPISTEEIQRRWPNLAENTGIRKLTGEKVFNHIPTRVAAPLAHRLENGAEEGGLREFAGLKQQDLKASPLKKMALLFDDDPNLGPSQQAQMMLYSGLLALAGLPSKLSDLIPAHHFRIGAGTCFQGHDAYGALASSLRDKFAYRLASTLNTHGPAMLNAMLSPAIELKADPEQIKRVLNGINSGIQGVPQAPLVSSGACASALLNFCDLAAGMLFDYPGHIAPQVTMLTSADATLNPDARVLEGFGPGAMITDEKLKKSGRNVSESLAPFDKDAAGTVVGHGGVSLLVTTLEFALKHCLNITSVVAGWGQSGESGGKQHMAGVGFGGNNAIISALMMAYQAHGFDLLQFEYLMAHASGTSTNSKTDLDSVNEARLTVSTLQPPEALNRMTVGAIKSRIGHTMGPTGAEAMVHALQYLNGAEAIGVPTFRTLHEDIQGVAAGYNISSQNVRSNGRGVLIPVQGFGGYDATVALMPATLEILSRYQVSDPRLLGAFTEAREEMRLQSEAREFQWSSGNRPLVELADYHRWPGID